MSWETQYQGRSTPERILSDQETRVLREWKERYLDVTLKQIKEKLQYAPDLRDKLSQINPDDQTAITNLAVKIGEDEAILAAIAFALRTNLIGTN